MKIKARNPKEVYLQLKADHKNPIFLEGFLYGLIVMSFVAAIVSAIYEYL